MGRGILGVLVSLLAWNSAYAARIQFTDTGTEAVFNSRNIASLRGEVPSVELELTIPGIDVNKEADGFDALSIQGLSASANWGSPELPMAGKLIAIPAGYKANLKIVSLDNRTVSDVFCKPSQKKLRCGSAEEAFSFNSRSYESNEYLPYNWAQLDLVGNLGGMQIARISLNPVRFNATAREIQVATNVKVRVDFEATGERQVVSMSPSLVKVVNQTTLNGRALGSLIRAAQPAELMLVLTADTLKETLTPFTAWKNAKGIQTKVVTYTEAGGTKEKVKEYIQKYYDTEAVKPTYLLFVGNKATMPAFMESTGSGNAASDYRFTLLSGNDNTPDVFYGRFIADNEADLKAQIQRSIDYEKAPEMAGWYNQATTIASNEGSGPSDKEYAMQVQDALKAGTYRKFDSFFQGDQNATSANISEALKEGRTWIAYFGHGSGTSWGSTNDSFSNATVTALENQGKLPVIIDVACLNSSWVSLPTPFGKAWVTHAKDGKAAGAVAFYGGSVSISWHPPAVMSVGVAKMHFEKKLPSLGATVLAGQLYLIEQMGTGNNTLDNVKWYNLFGDPSLVIRTDSPKEYKVKAKVTQRAAGTSVHVQAVDLAGTGVENLTVAVSVPRSPATIEIGKTNAMGEADVMLNGVGSLEEGTMVTLSGYNANTYQVTLK